MKVYTKMLLLLLTAGAALNGSAQKMAFPDQQWLKYAQELDAGFSQSGLDSLQRQFKRLGSSAFMVVIDGKVALDWGETARRFTLTSARKSLMSAMIGIYAHKGKINLNNTLAELGIDEVQPLTETEKQAKVIDLLAARSGIYLPSAYAPKSMIESLPTRGSVKPGEQWVYNNWDFNTLATIFNQQTGQDFFEAFQTDIAAALNMQDFRLMDGYYRYEADKSRHPAYLFKLSARDFARFGHLYLNQGQWKGKQIVPRDWVEKSTKAFTEDTGPRFQNFGSYGLLWWTMDIQGIRVHYASGAGGQRLYVLPTLNMVVAHLTNNYLENRLGEVEVNELLKTLLWARTGAPNPKAKLVDQTPIQKPWPTVPLDLQSAAKFQGNYQHPRLGSFKVKLENNALSLETAIGYFRLLSMGNDSFLVEDLEIMAEFKTGTAEQRFKVENVMNGRQLERVVLYY
jgi:CubicO group peptidase (beta-lactamase class C family)